MASAARAFAMGALVFVGVALVQWGCRALGATHEELRMASLGSIVLGNLLLLVWFRGASVRLTHTNTVFNALLVGVCVVWGMLTAVPGVGALFGLPDTSSPWALWVVLPAGWSLWRLFAISKRH